MIYHAENEWVEYLHDGGIKKVVLSGAMDRDGPKTNVKSPRLRAQLLCLR